MARIHLIYLGIDTGYFPGVNHGLASLAAAVRHNGHTLSLHHLASEEGPEAAVQRAREQSPDIIGFSFTSPPKKYAAIYAAALHKAMAVLQIAGGVHPSIIPEEVLKMGFFSGVAVGEAEISLPELLSRLDQGGRP